MDRMARIPLPKRSNSSSVTVVSVRARAEARLDHRQVNILGCDQGAMEVFFADLGEKAFRATQTLKWIHQHK